LPSPIKPIFGLVGKDVTASRTFMGFNPVSAIGKIALWHRLIIIYEARFGVKNPANFANFILFLMKK
jgi:hypothetical protein